MRWQLGVLSFPRSTIVEGAVSAAKFKSRRRYIYRYKFVLICESIRRGARAWWVDRLLRNASPARTDAKSNRRRPQYQAAKPRIPRQRVEDNAFHFGYSVR